MEKMRLIKGGVLQSMPGSHYHQKIECYMHPIYLYYQDRALLIEYLPGDPLLQDRLIARYKADYIEGMRREANRYKKVTSGRHRANMFLVNRHNLGVTRRTNESVSRL